MGSEVVGAATGHLATVERVKQYDIGDPRQAYRSRRLACAGGVTRAILSLAYVFRFARKTPPPFHRGDDTLFSECTARIWWRVLPMYDPPLP